MPRDYPDDQKWSVEKIQPIAIREVYSKVWPECEILELDNDQTNTLKKAFDIGGADKALKFPDGTICFLAQRFRTYKYSKHDDFTLRYSRPLSGYKTECEKVLRALKQNRMLAAFYVYGHVNEDEDSFLRLRILKFREFLEEWRKGKLPKPGLIPTKDGSATFVYWPFEKIPRNLIFYELTPQKNTPMAKVQITIVKVPRETCFSSECWWISTGIRCQECPYIDEHGNILDPRVGGQRPGDKRR